MNLSFDELIAAITDCNEKLYCHGEAAPAKAKSTMHELGEEDLWQQSPLILEQRALFLKQLYLIIDSLTPQQINTVGQLYESMLDSDQQHLLLAQAERLTTRNSLRAIKNAEKALPAYKAYKHNN